MASAFRNLAAVFVLILASAPASAANLASLSWLVGSWRGEGNMFGRASLARLEVSPALGGRFLEFGYRAGEFEGRAFYAPTADGRWRATWFDNRGMSFGIEAAASERMLTANWGSAETERGQTVYRLAEDGRLHVSDFVFRDGALHPFANHRLTRD